MDRNEFTKKLQNPPVITDEQKTEYITDMAASNPLRNNIICTIEELAELQIALTKHLRGEDSNIAILEEMADVLISLRILQNPGSEGQNLVDADTLEKAVCVKIERDYLRSQS